MTSKRAEVRSRHYSGNLLDPKQLDEKKQAYWDWIDSFAVRKHEAALCTDGYTPALGYYRKEVKKLLRFARDKSREFAHTCANGEIKDYPVCMQMPDGSVVWNESLPS